MRTDEELAYILGHIKASQMPATEERPPEQRSFVYISPELKRHLALGKNKRGERLQALAEVLASASGTPVWLARMGLELVYRPGFESDLDDPDNDPWALLLALAGMGLETEGVVWARGVTH